MEISTLKVRRIKANQTQSSLARFSKTVDPSGKGVSASTISRIEAGIRKYSSPPTLELLDRCLKSLSTLGPKNLPEIDL